MQEAYQYSVNFPVSDYSPAGGGGGEFFLPQSASAGPLSTW